MKMHLIQCIECSNEYYVRFPEELPKEAVKPCSKCGTNITLTYKEADDEGVYAEIEMEVEENVPNPE